MTDERFSLIHWLLVRRAAFREKHGRPRGLRVSVYVDKMIRNELAEKMGKRYARLLGGPAMFYCMIYSIKRDLSPLDVEFWN